MNLPVLGSSGFAVLRSRGGGEEKLCVHTLLSVWAVCSEPQYISQTYGWLH